MRLKSIILAVAVALIVPGAALSCALPGNAAAMRAEALRLVNAERKRAGLRALSPSPALQEAAQFMACDNAGQRRLSHRGADGSELQNRLRRVGYRYRTANENLGQGFRDPAAAVSWWMGSPSHRSNILDRDTRDVGIGVAQGSDKRPYWAMVSGASN